MDSVQYTYCMYNTTYAHMYMREVCQLNKNFEIRWITKVDGENMGIHYVSLDVGDLK